MTKHAACVAHFRDGIDWEDTGIFEFSAKVIDRDGQLDGCKTPDDVRRRYDGLDQLFEQVRSEGRLRTANELDPESTPGEERDGIFLHVGPGGTLLSGAGGIHRLAISQVLDLPVAPAQLGCVHPDGLSALDQLRSPEAQVAEHTSESVDQGRAAARRWSRKWRR